MKVVITADGSRTLHCDDAGESFHSMSGAYSESRTVFVENSGAAARLGRGSDTAILEVGLGTGLNFLLTADVAITNGSRLRYTGIDPRLPGPKLVRELGYQVFLRNKRLLSCWLEFLADRECGFGSSPSDQLELHVIEQPAQMALSQSTSLPLTCFDCIYHDAFSPESAPGLWSTDFLGELYRWLQPGGILVTYCVKSAIQKRLCAVGFEVDVLPGPEGGKRQVLVAKRPTLEPE